MSSRLRQRLYGPAQLAAAAATLYTVPEGQRAALRNLYLNNPSGSLRKATFSIGADAAATRFLDAFDVPAGTSTQKRMTHHTLEAGESIQGYADAASTVVAVIDGYLLLLTEDSGFPNESNTGPTGALTPVSGERVITVDDTTIENEERTGNYVVQADNVTIRNCKIIHDGTAAIDNNGSAVNLLVEDVEIDLTSGGVGAGGISSFNYTARRCNVYGGENLMWAETNVLIEDCYLHDTVPYNPIDDPHTDGIQMPTTTENVTIRHNTIYGGYVDEDNFGNSAITSGESINVLIDNNLLAGGGVTLRCPNVPTDFEWRDNRFSRIFTDTVGGFGPVTDGSLQTHSGNVYHETGLPVDPG